MSVQRQVFPESGLTAGAVARKLGLHETVLRRWMAQFGMQATGQNGLGASRRSTTQASSSSPSDLAAELARLRRENGQLRMKREPTVGA